MTDDLSSAVATYGDVGYCLIPDLIPADAVAAARARLDEILAEPPDWAPRCFQDLDPSRCPGDRPVPAGIQRPALHDAAFDAVARHDHLARAMAALLGGPVELFTDQLGIKHGWNRDGQGGMSFWHQDSWYWKIAPELGCNCWIPLHDVGRDAIALAVMPGSQRGWELTPHETYYDDPPMGRVVDGVFQPFQRHRIPAAAAGTGAEHLVDMKPGDGLFFSNYTWHRSEPNRSGQTKAFYAIAWQRTEAAPSN